MSDGRGLVEWVIVLATLSILIISVITAIQGGLQTTTTDVKTKLTPTIASIS